jgi:putative ABC transport system permease protein
MRTIAAPIDPPLAYPEGPGPTAGAGLDPIPRQAAVRAGAAQRAQPAAPRRTRRHRVRLLGPARVVEALRFAVQAVLSARLRSTLTVLSILIGVAAVVELVAVGAGSRAAVAASIQRLGTSTVYVSPHQVGTGGNGSEQQNELRRALGLAPPPPNATDPRKPELTWADAQALQNSVLAPDVAAVAPGIWIGGVQAQYGTASHSIGTLIGTTTSFLGINDETVTAGRAFTDADTLVHAHDCLLGRTVAADLTSADPNSLVGRRIRLNGRPFTVVGVLGVKGYSGQSDMDNVAICTATSVADSLYGYAPPGQGPINGIAVQANAPAAVPAAQAEVTAILDSRHHTAPVDSDFVTYNAASLLTASSSAAQTLTVLLAAVAGICLLVGGIGVMNTMLIAVTERTKEIGIRKAVGAGRRDILGQFLGEAVTLSMIGGGLGALVGIGLCRLHVAGVSPVLAPWSVGTAMAVTFCTGLFFGLYPAYRAAALSPIEALRYE